MNPQKPNEQNQNPNQNQNPDAPYRDKGTGNEGQQQRDEEGRPLEQNPRDPFADEELQRDEGDDRLEP